MPIMSKSVCIIRSNPVRPDSRVEKEACSLKMNGYDVHVLAWDRDSNHKPCEEMLLVMGLEIPITRLGFKASYGEGFKNIVSYLKFQFGMRKFLRKNYFDVIHACDFDTAFFSQGIVKRKKEKFIFDIFDFIASNPKTLFQKIICCLQINLINRSDATIICTEDRKRQISASKPKKLAIIHNSPKMFPESYSKEFFDFEKNGKVKVVYVGILQDYRLLKEIGEYFSKNHEIEWHVGGFGKYEEHFKKLADENENIKFYGRISYDKTIELERKCDICLAIYDPAIHNHVFAAPNKFYESLMLGKPVVMVKGTGMSEIVKKKDIGVLIDYSYDGFEKGINELISRKNSWIEMSERMKRIYIKDYNWEIMEKRLCDLYEGL